MKNEIKYIIKVCKECEGVGFIKSESCTCTDCEINNTCSNCYGKGVILILKENSKNNVK